MKARDESDESDGRIRLVDDMDSCVISPFTLSDLNQFEPLYTICANMFRLVKPSNICLCELNTCADDEHISLPKNAANYTHVIYVQFDAVVVVYNAQKLASLKIKISDKKKDEDEDEEDDAAPSSSSSAASPQSSFSSSPPCMSSPFAVIFSVNALIQYDVSSICRHQLSHEVRADVSNLAAQVQVYTIQSFLSALLISVSVLLFRFVGLTTAFLQIQSDEGRVASVPRQNSRSACMVP